MWLLFHFGGNKLKDFPFLLFVSTITWQHKGETKHNMKCWNVFMLLHTRHMEIYPPFLQQQQDTHIAHFANILILYAFNFNFSFTLENFFFLKHVRDDYQEGDDVCESLGLIIVFIWSQWI